MKTLQCLKTLRHEKKKYIYIEKIRKMREFLYVAGSVFKQPDTNGLMLVVEHFVF